jgi:hypothetical protein
MVFDVENLGSIMTKFGDKTEKYSDEEEAAMEEYYRLIDSKFSYFITLCIFDDVFNVLQNIFTWIKVSKLNLFSIFLLFR